MAFGGYELQALQKSTITISAPKRIRHKPFSQNLKIGCSSTIFDSIFSRRLVGPILEPHLASSFIHSFIPSFSSFWTWISRHAQHVMISVVSANLCWVKLCHQQPSIPRPSVAPYQGISDYSLDQVIGGRAFVVQIQVIQRRISPMIFQVLHIFVLLLQGNP